MNKYQLSINKLGGAQYTSQKHNALYYSKLEFLTLSPVNMILYTTSQLCMTGLTFLFRVAQE